jgi:hypothetical protein
MKKIGFVFLVMVLSACQTPTLDIRQELLTTIKAQQSFVVEESFEWNRFATLNNAPWNEFIAINNTITFQNNRYLTQHFLDAESNTDRVIERTLFQAESYKNIYSRDAAIRINRQWYNVELPIVNAVGLGGLDPVLVVSELLYNNTELYYKSDTGVTGDISSFRIAVATISDRVFHQLFEHTVAAYVEFPYAYTVTAELRFNDAYEVTSIEFDLTRLIRQYSDYFSVQQGAVFNSLSGQYSLTYSSYQQVDVGNLPIGISMQPSNQLLANFEQAVIESDYVRPQLSRVTDPTTGEPFLRIELQFLQAGRIALVEVIGRTQGQVRYSVQRQVVGMNPATPLVLERIASANQWTDLHVSIRYVEQQNATVIFETFNATPLLRAHFNN